MKKRVTVKEKAKQIAELLDKKRVNYFYLKDLFGKLRKELGIEVKREPQKLPYVPTEEEMKKYYEIVFKSKNMQNVLIIKTMLYTGIRVGELVLILMEDVDLDKCTINISNNKGKNRIVPFPQSFKEALAVHIGINKRKNAIYLFESLTRKHRYSVRGIRKILAEYAKAAQMGQSMSPNKLRHFLFTWMKKQNIEDELILPYSGLQSKHSLEKYEKLSIAEVQKEYEKIIKQFPV